MFSSEVSHLISKEFSHLSSLYFNSAYFGPSPYRAKQKISNAVFKELDPSFFPYNTWMGIPELNRKKIAQLLDCSSDQIAHTTSVTDSISMIAQNIPLNPSDVVVSFKGEYPSNVLPWMLASSQRGFQFKLLDCALPDVDFLKNNLPTNCKIVNLSHVAFDSGRKIDLESMGKFLKQRNIIFIVDATQSLGGMSIKPNELSLIDILACSTYKWCLGPYGSSFLYLTSKMIDLLPRSTGNWINSINSKEVHHLTDYTLEVLPGARKFDRGQTPNMLIMACQMASLEFLLELELENIEKHNAELRNYFLENYSQKKYQLVSPSDRAFLGNIISLRSLKADPLELETELKHHNIDVSVREGKVRLSFHLFNTKQQVEQLISTLDF